MAPAAAAKFMDRFERNSVTRDGLCVPFAISNAAHCVGRTLDTRVIIRHLEREKLLHEDGTVVDLRKSVGAIQDYAKDRGVRLAYETRLREVDLTKHLPAKPQFPMERGVVGVLARSYLDRFHEEMKEIPADLVPARGTVGPEHAVTLIARDDAYTTFFDPDRALKNSESWPGWPQGTVRMTNEVFTIHYNEGSAPTEAVLAEVRFAEAEPKPEPKRRAEKPLEAIV